MPKAVTTPSATKHRAAIMSAPVALRKLRGHLPKIDSSIKQLRALLVTTEKPNVRLATALATITAELKALTSWRRSDDLKIKAEIKKLTEARGKTVAEIERISGSAHP